MIEVEYMDDRGRKFAVKVDNAEAEEMYKYGIPVGPPDIVDGLGLPEEIATRLHNELFQRKLWTEKDVSRNPKAVFAALQAALRVNQQKIMTAYHDYEKETDS